MNRVQLHSNTLSILHSFCSVFVFYVLQAEVRIQTLRWKCCREIKQEEHEFNKILDYGVSFLLHSEIIVSCRDKSSQSSMHKCKWWSTRNVIIFVIIILVWWQWIWWSSYMNEIIFLGWYFCLQLHMHTNNNAVGFNWTDTEVWILFLPYNLWIRFFLGSWARCWSLTTVT